MIKAVIDDLGIPNQDGFFDKDIDGTKYLTDGWQQRTYEKFKDVYPPQVLLFYINHLAWELAKSEEVFQVPAVCREHEPTILRGDSRGRSRQGGRITGCRRQLLAAKDEKGLGAYTAAKYSGRNDIAALLLEKGVELDIFAACMAGAKDRALELIGENPELINCL